MGPGRLDAAISQHVEAWRAAKFNYWFGNLHTFSAISRDKRHALKAQIFAASGQRNPELPQQMNRDMLYLKARKMLEDVKFDWALNAAYHLHRVFHRSPNMAALDRYLDTSGIRAGLGLLVALGEPLLPAIVIV
jgi:hypothetical protein